MQIQGKFSFKETKKFIQSPPEATGLQFWVDELGSHVYDIA
ncbi:hypothetical protein C943_01954 [Mariniradius saccharolyticus AK6]|uniref:Uncharacterized protein n=1 Tax=Mariniradius saccharolyticus AK6 TaxID=1239962 RepID=M7XAL2_9BACT|nr:hypothetical protein C943_01954 [Mariniradius saccharolyticus AK6]